MLKFLAIVLGLYLAFVGLVYAMQGRLLYLPDMPGRELGATPAARSGPFGSPLPPSLDALWR